MKHHAEAESFYLSMLNALSGVQDDLDANEAPIEARELLRDVITLCRRDYDAKFSAQSAKESAARDNPLLLGPGNKC